MQSGRLPPCGDSVRPKAISTSIYLKMSSLEIEFSAPKRLYLMRHGHTFDANTKKTMPSYHAELTEKGLQQAEQTAQYIHQHVKLEALYCSGLNRTHETLKPLAQLQNLEITALEALNEIPLQLPASKTFGDVLKAYLHLAEELKHKDEADIWITPEITFSQFMNGTLHALHQILNGPGRQVGVMAHGGVNMLLLCHFTQSGYHNLMRFYQENCCINIIDCIPPSTFIIRLINFTCYDPLKADASITWD